MTPHSVNEAISYEQAKAVAAHRDPEVRKRLASRPDVPAEILYFLAEDADPEVRRAVAANMAAPHQTHMLLARDSDTAVRSGLAEKVARILPNVSAAERDKVRRAAHESLEVLASDQLTVVRRVLAEALKDVADAPLDVIRTLARDTELSVAAPVLEFSPVLTDEDLIAIIESGPAAGGLNAISRRQGLAETVADAIVATDDVQAIGTLLGNKSAQIREETLDQLIERSGDVALWQSPLVGRPRLPARAAAKLARVVADNLLDVLKQRADLDPATLAAVKSVVHQRLGGEEGAAGPEAPSAAVDFLKIEPPIDVAERLYQANKLDAKVIAKALNASDNAFVFAALIVRSGVDLKTARKIMAEKNPKAVVALSWKAGLPMRMAVQVQQRIARIPPSEVLMPMVENDYPLGDEEMKWQIEFYGSRAAKQSG